MSADQAIAIVESSRAKLGIDEDLQVSSTERAFLWVLTRHRLAWLVTLSCDWGFVRVGVDDQNGEVLEVKRSA